MTTATIAVTVDAKGLSCPMPIVKTAQAAKTVEPGALIGFANGFLGGFVVLRRLALALGVAVAATLILGVYPKLLFDVADASARTFGMTGLAAAIR